MYGRPQIVGLDAIAGSNVRTAQADKFQLHRLDTQPCDTVVLLLRAFQKR